GDRLVYATYLGGGSDDQGNGIAVTPDGDAFVAGTTGSSDFPTTAAAYQTTFSGSGVGPTDAFVARLNATGEALLYSTFLGGSLSSSTAGATQSGKAIAVDPKTDIAYVTGTTTASNFPTSGGAYQTTNAAESPSYQDVFVTALNTQGTGLVYSSYLDHG